MKNNTIYKLLVVLTLLGHSYVGMGQLLTSEELKAGNYLEIDRLLTTTHPSEEGLLEDPEVFPLYPGGLNGVLRDFTSSIVYPMKARRKRLEGQFAIRYVIEKDGKISFFNLIETHGPVDELLKEAAIQAMSGMKRWHPGFLRGEPVRVLFTQPVNFKLSK